MQLDSRSLSTSATADVSHVAEHGEPRQPTSRRWLWRCSFVVGLIVVLACSGLLVGSLMPESEEAGKLTQTIARGDLSVTIIEQGLLESAENTEIKCQVRGQNTVIWVIESGSIVEPGDELVRLETFYIEEQIDERSKYAHWSQSGADHSKAQLARSELAVPEYEEGRYVTALMNLEKDLAIAESKLRSETSMLAHAKLMAEKGYVSELTVEEREFALAQAKLQVEVKKTEIDVLRQFTKKEQLQTLKGDLAANEANHKANSERATADASRRDRAIEEYEHCVVKAERAGLVIHPSAAKWFDAPEIAEGTTVHMDQILLLMPDLSQMQVKVGIHESVVDKITPGLSVKVTIPNRVLDGEVSEVASVAKPAGWWTGNEVRYDTLVALPDVDGLKPGMSAEVEILVAEYHDVLKIPVAAIVENDEEACCWVKHGGQAERRSLKLGDSNDIFTIVQSGLKEGDEVVLNPQAYGGTQTSTEKASEDKKLESKKKEIEKPNASQVKKP